MLRILSLNYCVLDKNIMKDRENNFKNVALLFMSEWKLTEFEVFICKTEPVKWPPYIWSCFFQGRVKMMRCAPSPKLYWTVIENYKLKKNMILI